MLKYFCKNTKNQLERVIVWHSTAFLVRTHLCETVPGQFLGPVVPLNVELYVEGEKYTTGFFQFYKKERLAVKLYELTFLSQTRGEAPCRPLAALIASNIGCG